ncbi:hypothetical protein GMORB2_4517 [Geosmithia morbida]|uniref:Uncharacterized protein n=1 Tax=Geosmithia morbida TaxID=1094350 RepID=A0A9P4YQ04_9HYPO|nr:uncharacterized protein GMORB2_4517 [Geosmithia morbida]KAF4119608.1 hypothetical protein GMORB2_4517 [Geosmithia morbida]
MYSWSIAADHAAAHVSRSAQDSTAAASTTATATATTTTVVAQAANETTASTDELQWSSAKSIRTSVITLASFNVLAATITIICIVRDARALDERGSLFRLRGKRSLPPPSPWMVYPLILSLAIVAQGIIFAVEQAKGLQGFVIQGCIPVAQAMMPALFIVPVVQLILGFETAVASLFRRAFPPRARWVYPTCIAVSVAGLLGLYGATRALPPPDKCYASLFWFAQQWRPVCFGLLVGIASTIFVSTIITFVKLRLSTTNESHPGERQAASHMVYYMSVATISNALLIPFFFNITYGQGSEMSSSTTELSTVSSVVANLSGLMTGGLYLYLRGGNQTSRGSTWDYLSEGEKQEFVLLKQQQMMSPIGPAPSTPPIPPIYHDEKPPVVDGEYDDGTRSSVVDNPQPPPPPRRSFMSWLMPPRSNNNSSSSNEFDADDDDNNSNNNNNKSLLTLPSTTYSPNSTPVPPRTQTPESMLMPPPLFHAGSTGLSPHQRNLSAGSLETVRIGIRISNVNGSTTEENTIANSGTGNNNNNNNNNNKNKTASIISRTQSRFPNLSQFFPPTMPVMEDSASTAPAPGSTPSSIPAAAASAPADDGNETLSPSTFKGQLPRNPSPLRNMGRQSVQKDEEYSPHQTPTRAKLVVVSPNGTGRTMSSQDGPGGTRGSPFGQNFGSGKPGWI